MKKIRTVITSWDSLYKRLLSSFLLVILLISSFHFFSFSLFKDSINEEIIKYNQQNMDNTVENFESYYNDVKTLVYSIYFNEHVINYKTHLQTTNSTNYILANEVNTVINTAIYHNKKLSIENIIAYFGENQLAIDRNTISGFDDILQTYYSNEKYNAEFFLDKINNEEITELFPVAKFLDYTDSPAKTEELLPIKIRSHFSKDTLFLVFVRANEVFDRLHFSINDDFVIMKNEELIYSSTDEIKISNVPELPSEKGYVKIEDNYVFYRVSLETGFTYLNIIPTDAISSKSVQLNVLLIILIFIAICISIGTAILLSNRINNPIKEIINSLEQFSSSEHLESNIKEFNFISNHIKKIVEANQEIKQDITKKNNVLKNFAFMNQIKNIKDGTNTDITFEDLPFIIVMFDIRFRNQVNQQEKMNVINENINLTIKYEFSKSLAVQIESNQVISLIFLEDGQSDLSKVINDMKNLFDKTKDDYLVTIGVSRIHQHASKMTEAYQEATKLLDQRKLREETQVIHEFETTPKTIIMSLTEEQKFYAYMQAGNKEGMTDCIKKILHAMVKEDSFSAQFTQFTKNLINRVKFHLFSINIRIDGLEKYSDCASKCNSIDEFIQLFDDFFTEVADVVNNTDKSEDQIISFVMSYIEEHYSEDLSLDLIADKLKITSSYLSYYFKEKTGTNFSDYLNERRINRAKELLEDSSMKIKDISRHVGYHNVNSFIRMFKKILGVTPGEYRKKSIS